MRKNYLTFSIYFTLSLIFPLTVSAHNGNEFFGHHMDMGYGFFGGGIFMILFLLLLIVGIVYLVRYMAESGRRSDQKNDRIIEILEERYAKGEISKEEFEKKKKELLKR